MATSTCTTKNRSKTKSLPLNVKLIFIFDRWVDLDIIDREQVMCRWIGYLQARCDPLSIQANGGLPSLKDSINNLDEICQRYEDAK